MNWVRGCWAVLLREGDNRTRESGMGIGDWNSGWERKQRDCIPMIHSIGLFSLTGFCLSDGVLMGRRLVLGRGRRGTVDFDRDRWDSIGGRN